MREISIRIPRRRVSFAQWSRKGYGVFSSLNAIVRIGVVTASYSLLAMPMATFAQTDTVTVSKNVDIDEVAVHAPRPATTYSELARIVTTLKQDELNELPATTLHEALDGIPSVDIRQRGAHAVQSDVSIRGGSFDQVLILLNGVNITDAQTGHHNLNIPIALEVMDRIEILSGPGARVYGPGAFSGAINIVTTPPESNEATFGLTAGEHGLLKTLATAGIANSRSRVLVSASTASSQGFTQNTDFNTTNLFGHAVVQAPKGVLSIQAGYQDKGFGANSFYTPTFPNQYEHITSLFGSIGYSYTAGRLTVEPKAYYRRHTDRFDLFRREAPEWYTTDNHHLTQTLGGGVTLTQINSIGKIRAGIDYRHEQVISNVLGDTLAAPLPVTGYPDAFYTVGHSRGLATLFADNTLTFGMVNLSFGGLVAHSSQYDISYSYGTDIGLRINDWLRPFASYNHAIRYPTFTELFYSGPNNIGNPNLKPEYAHTYELGMRTTGSAITSNIAAFYRQGKDLIDWVKSPNASPDSPWETMNHTTINTSGLEGNVTIYTTEYIAHVRRLSLGYSFIDLDKKESEVLSYYVLDYLRHKATLSLTHTVWNDITASWEMVYQSREGSYTHHPSGEERAYPPFTLINARIQWQFEGLQIFGSVTNLTNRDYIDIANVPQPGRWIAAGLVYRIKG